ncbi:MAG: hypothetical protein LKF97_08115, partial [Atopobiaceae bacterium]|nr:hypothetical protein [Atopobiaceae bacterium]
MSPRRRLATLTLVVAAILAATIAAPSTALAEGRSIACMGRDTAAATVADQPDDLVWESLMDLPTGTVDDSYTTKTDALEATSDEGGTTLVLVTSETLSSEDLTCQLEQRDDVLFADEDEATDAETDDDQVTTQGDTTSQDDSDVVSPSRTYLSYQWFLKNTGLMASGVAGADIDLPSTTTRGSGTVVAVIDGGVDGTNPNLAANMVDLTTYPGLQS